AANIIGEVRQSDCGYGVLELDTLRYNVYKAMFLDLNKTESMNVVALVFSIIAFIILPISGLIKKDETGYQFNGEYLYYILGVEVGLLILIIGFGTIVYKSTRSAAPNIASYIDHLKKVSEYLGKLNLKMLRQAQMNPEGTKVKNDDFSLPLYILEQRLLSRIQNVEDKKSSLETNTSLESKDGAGLVKYIAFETDADLLLETLAAYDSSGKRITNLETYNDQKTKKLNTVINKVELTLENIKDYKDGLEALKDTSFDDIRTEVNNMLGALKWIMYISSALILFAVYMFITDKVLGGDSFWIQVAFGVIVCIHITLYSFIG
ncbi:MAG: hypothetical protein ACO222_05435, partial [Polynucleobacter sp.]